jgi:hypothetical protein
METLSIWKARPAATINRTPHRTVTWMSISYRCPLGTCLEIHIVHPLDALLGQAARPHPFFRGDARTVVLSVQPLCRAGRKCVICRPRA